MSRWRLIDSGTSAAWYNMALDEALAIKAEGPVLRFYGWSEPSVSIGCFQKADEVDLKYISNNGIPLVRRITGGRGILHGHELTYSLSAAAEGIFSGGLKNTYMLIGEAFASAFRAIGLNPEFSHPNRLSQNGRSPVCFESASLGEIKVAGRKVIGSAQKRWPGRFLQQGAIPFSMDFDELAKVFPECGKSDARGVMAGLLDEDPSLSAEALKGALTAAFEEVFGIELNVSEPTSAELDLAEELGFKYRAREWNLNRQRSVSPASIKVS